MAKTKRLLLFSEAPFTLIHQTKSTKRLNDALALRDAALMLLRNNGELTKIENSPGRFLSYHSEELYLLHRTPFQRLPELSEKTKYLMALSAQHGLEPKLNKDYGLDIWYDGKKVFNVEWEEVDSIEIVGFQRGDWENEIMDVPVNSHLSLLNGT